MPLQVNAFGSVLTPFFTDQPVREYASATSANTAAYAKFFRGMLARGMYPPPSQFEAWFLSAAHTVKDVDKTIAAAREAMREVSEDTRYTVDTKQALRLWCNLRVLGRPLSCGDSRVQAGIETHAQHGAGSQLDVLAFSRGNRATTADQNARERAFHATENPTDDRADAGAGADLARLRP